MGLTDLDTVFGLSPITAAATLFVLVLAMVFYFDVGVPPGPRGLPFFGYWPFLDGGKVHLQLHDLSRTYGDVFSFRSAGHLFVHLGSIKAVREAHLTKADCFSRRYEGFNVLTALFPTGMICLNSEPWRAQRRFFLQAFKEFGISSAKKFMEGPVYDAVRTAVDTLGADPGKPVDVIPIVSRYSSAILRRMVFNDGEISDDELADVVVTYPKALELFTDKLLLLYGTFAKFFMFPLMAVYRTAMENKKKLTEILLRVVKRHEETFKADNIRDVIDAYIRERNDRQRKNDPTAQSFTNVSLVSSLEQILGDGTLGVALLTSYLISSLVEHPEEQEKLHDEMEEIIGSDRDPTIEDKVKLPYMNAFIYEVMRTMDFPSVVSSLECTKETTLSGHPVPKGSISVVNFWSCHHDPEVFKDPDAFRPSRYMPAGPDKLKDELPITFGVGRRSCAGENYVITQTYLLLATLTKNFRLEKPSASNNCYSFTDTSLNIIVIPRKN